MSTKLAFVILAFSSAILSAIQAHAFPLNNSAVADVEIGERPATPDFQDRGVNTDQLNTRFATDRSELIALRFDLTSVMLDHASTATLNLYNFRDSSARPYILYGVNDGATGGDNNGTVAGFTDDNWDETTVKMSTMPGLIYDANAATQGIDAAKTVNLGGGTFAATAKGQVQSLAATGLFAFLQSHPDKLVTLLLARDPANMDSGQDRFASKEATALDAGDPTGVAGTFAPFLQFEISGLPGDTDNDGVIEPEDLTPIRNNWRKQVAARTDGDLTGDFFVDFADFRQWKTAFIGAGSGGSLEGIDFGFLNVPEPATLTLFACSAAIGLLSGWRKR